MTEKTSCLPGMRNDLSKHRHPPQKKILQETYVRTGRSLGDAPYRTWEGEQEICYAWSGREFCLSPCFFFIVGNTIWGMEGDSSRIAPRCEKVTAAFVMISDIAFVLLPPASSSRGSPSPCHNLFFLSSDDKTSSRRGFAVLLYYDLP